MRAVKFSLLLTIGLVQCGCAKPIMLRIDTMQTEPAEVTLDLTKGDAVAVPHRCETPCSVEIAPKSAHVLTLRAPGYYPAIMDLTYDTAVLHLRNTGNKVGNLVVPMQERQDSSEAADNSP